MRLPWRRRPRPAPWARTGRLASWVIGAAVGLLTSPGWAQPACGGDGQRACCLLESDFGACRSGHSEVPSPNAGLCGGGNAFGIQSSGVCVADTPCGGADERACCVGESSFGACQPWLAEERLPNAGQCSRSLPGIQSSGVCRPVPCGAEHELACTPAQNAQRCQPHLAEVDGVCTFRNDSLPRRHHLGFPMRGTVPWTVLLCRYRDQPVGPTQTSTHYRQLLRLRGSGGLPDYLHEVSRGLFAQDMHIHGWFVVDKDFANRGSEVELGDCTEAARVAGFVPPAHHFVMVVPPSDSGARPQRGHRVLVPPLLDGLLHEMWHVYGLLDNRSHVAIDYSRPAPPQGDPAHQEYGDPFDVMAWRATHPGRPSAFGGTDGPRLNGYTLDRLGWIGADEAVTFGAAGETRADYSLAPLYAPHQGGTRIVRVPIGVADPRHYYQIEFRAAEGRDRNIGAHQVLVYEVKRRVNARQAAASSERAEPYLLRTVTDGSPLQTLNMNGISITISTVAADGSSAQVSVRSELSLRCRMGSVWRMASPQDRVCVDGTARARVAEENRLAASRRQPGGGAFGPNTCRQGFVWRDAFVGDQVCVDGRARAAAAAENASAGARSNPAALVVGPHACKAGFVWRLIDRFDFVCVSASRRDEALADTRQDAARRAITGASPCPAGQIERRAFAGDRVCTSLQASIRARQDSSAAWSRKQFLQ